jgi:hypothetical protein
VGGSLHASLWLRMQHAQQEVGRASIGRVLSGDLLTAIRGFAFKSGTASTAAAEAVVLILRARRGRAGWEREEDAAEAATALLADLAAEGWAAAPAGRTELGACKEGFMAFRERFRTVPAPWRVRDPAIMVC